MLPLLGKSRGDVRSSTHLCFLFPCPDTKLFNLLDKAFDIGRFCELDQPFLRILLNVGGAKQGMLVSI